MRHDKFVAILKQYGAEANCVGTRFWEAVCGRYVIAWVCSPRGQATRVFFWTTVNGQIEYESCKGQAGKILFDFLTAACSMKCSVGRWSATYTPIRTKTGIESALLWHCERFLGPRIEDPQALSLADAWMRGEDPCYLLDWLRDHGYIPDA